MTLEEALIDLGDNPLVKSPYSAAIRAIVNATLNDPAKIITPSSTGGDVLTLVYQVADIGIRDQLLNKNLATVRDKDYYRLALLGMAILIAVITIALVLNVTLGEGHATDNSTGLLQSIIDNLFDLIRRVMGLEGDTPSS